MIKTEQLHATTVDLDGLGIMLTGPSGSGKSDLALRLIDGGAKLVADDRTNIVKQGDCLFASAPDNLKGLLEVRGIGIIRQEFVEQSPVRLVIDLTERDHVDRLPDENFFEFQGVNIPLYAFPAFDASVPAKVRLALALVSGDIMPAPDFLSST